jgi:hypothetical protein
MQRTEHQMARKRCLDRNLGSFNVSNFSHHDHIRILPEDMAETVGERKTYLGFYLHLPNARQLVFNRVFNRDDVTLLGPKLVDGRIQGGRLTAARGPSEQYYAVRDPN